MWCKDIFSVRLVKFNKMIHSILQHTNILIRVCCQVNSGVKFIFSKIEFQILTAVEVLIQGQFTMTLDYIMSTISFEIKNVII